MTISAKMNAAVVFKVKLSLTQSNSYVQWVWPNRIPWLPEMAHKLLGKGQQALLFYNHIFLGIKNNITQSNRLVAKIWAVF